MENKLNLAIELFEVKIDRLENIYKNNHKVDFDKDKMKQFVNRNLKREIMFLTAFNVKPSIEFQKVK